MQLLSTTIIGSVAIIVGGATQYASQSTPLSSERTSVVGNALVLGLSAGSLSPPSFNVDAVVTGAAAARLRRVFEAAGGPAMSGDAARQR